MSVTKFGSVEKERRAALFFYLFENVWQGGKFTPPPTEIGLKSDFLPYLYTYRLVGGK